jgi:hypothetical protein
VVRGSGEVNRWCLSGGGKVYGWWDLDFREFEWWALREKGEERWRVCMALGESGEKGRESDLKAGHVRPKNEYGRT